LAANPYGLIYTDPCPLLLKGRPLWFGSRRRRWERKKKNEKSERKGRRERTKLRTSIRSSIVTDLVDDA